MNNCTAGALTAAVITGLLMSLAIPEHPEKPFVDQNKALLADNKVSREKFEAYLKEQIDIQKKRAELAESRCRK